MVGDEVRTMTDTNTKDVETQKPNGDSASICSTVKTPLVDALRLYFNSIRKSFEDEVEYAGNLNG